MKSVTIYGLYDHNSQLRYVGKTNNPKKRLSNHASPGRQNIAPVAKWARSMRKRGFQIIMKTLEVTENWETAERKWIKHYRKNGINLLNVSEGGLEMGHVTTFQVKFPAYMWAMRFCGRIKNDHLASVIKQRATEARNIGGVGAMARFDDELRMAVITVAPLTKIPLRVC